MAEFNEVSLREMTITTTGEVVLRWKECDDQDKISCEGMLRSLCEANGFVAIREDDKSGRPASYFKIEVSVTPAPVAPDVSQMRRAARFATFFIAVTIAMLSSASENVGIAGLVKTTFPEVDFISLPYLGVGAEVTTNCCGMYDEIIPARTTYAYSGYMYFTANCNYLFKTKLSGYTRVKIDGSLVFNLCDIETTTLEERTANVSFENAGWRKVEFRVSGNMYSDGGRVKNADYQGVWFKRETENDWHMIADPGDGSLLRTGSEYCGVEIVSAGMRPSDPSIMDVVYKVHSNRETVDVRAIAYEDGNRSLANTVIIESFAEGTEANLGSGITANTEHKISWRVANDWKADLAKVRVEILARDDALLQLLLITIPKTKSHAAIQFSDTELSDTHVFNALLWLYAGKQSGLTLTNGILRYNDTQLASGTTVVSSATTIAWLYELMGYSVLAGDDLSYVNSAARLNLAPSGMRQYAVKQLGD